MAKMNTEAQRRQAGELLDTLGVNAYRDIKSELGLNKPFQMLTYDEAFRLIEYMRSETLSQAAQKAAT